MSVSIVAQVSDVVPEPLVIQVDPNSTIFTTFHKHSLDSIYFRTLNCVINYTIIFNQ